MHARAALRPLTALAAAAVLVLALAACGKDSKNDASATTTTKKDTPTTAAKADDDDDAASTVVAKDFSLTSITVKAGEDVYFSNKGNATHTMTADDGTSFDTGHIDPGKSAEFKAPKAGTYTFHCAIHASMKGTLTVQ